MINNDYSSLYRLLAPAFDMYAPQIPCIPDGLYRLCEEQEVTSYVPTSSGLQLPQCPATLKLDFRSI